MCGKRQHSPRQPRAVNHAYQKVNAYTLSYAPEQIFTLLFFLLIIALHSIFIISPVTVINHAVLWWLFGLTYFFLLIIAYDYLQLTCGDPVDDFLLGMGQSKSHPYPDQQLKRCLLCNNIVHIKSYHCMRCNRCTQMFDHHCKYLNNCIGGKNYHSFIRILIIVTIFCLDILAQAIWIFIASYSIPNFNSEHLIATRWMILAIMILVLVALLSVDSLLVFHIYITCCRGMTTIEYIWRQTPSNPSQSTGSGQVLSQHNNV